jgi:hypothetical protein
VFADKSICFQVPKLRRVDYGSGSCGDVVGHLLLKSTLSRYVRASPVHLCMNLCCRSCETNCCLSIKQGGLKCERVRETGPALFMILMI